MASSLSETASPTPFSPFSTHSGSSDLATSDETPDLGAFTTVFRALNELQPRHFPFVTAAVSATPAPLLQQPLSSSTTPSLLSPLEYDSDTHRGSTVWNHQPIASYLSYTHSSTSTSRELASSRGTRSLPPSEHLSSEDNETEGEPFIDDDIHEDDEHEHTHDDEEDEDEEEDEDVDEDNAPFDRPSLGYLDEALDFIAAERAKLAAQRASSSTAYRGNSSTSESPWHQSPSARRKRRRKKAKSIVRNILRREPGADSETVAAVAAAATTILDAEEEEDESSSSLDASSPYYKSTPATPPKRKKERRAGLNTAVEANPRLGHSKSTPSLRTLAVPLDPRLARLRLLSAKLRSMFPDDAERLNASTVLSNDQHSNNFTSSASPSIPIPFGFLDTRGPAPRAGQPLTHVFIDFSNILIGYLNHLRRHPHHLHLHSQHPTQRHQRNSSTSNTGTGSGSSNAPSSHKQPKHLSHSALALILERCRPVTRRVLAASSPLYQPMGTAEQLGYEVRVYARVPDTGDGADRLAKYQQQQQQSHQGQGPTQSIPQKKGRAAKHRRRISAGGTSTSNESETGHQGPQQPQLHLHRPFAGPLQQQQQQLGLHSNSSTGRVKMREQGVDELLQLKLHQAIADVDTPPPGSTIVLATGDGNVGQFNEEGFLGCVKTALKKGWKVELYAWESGLARAWVREFGDGGNPSLARRVGDGRDNDKDREGGKDAKEREREKAEKEEKERQQQQWVGKFRIIFMDQFGADLLDG